MFTGGQMINYEKYKEALVNLPAPILGEQLPKVQIDLAGLMAYAREKGVKACDLSEKRRIDLYWAVQWNLFKKVYEQQFDIRIWQNGIRQIHRAALDLRRGKGAICIYDSSLF